MRKHHFLFLLFAFLFLSGQALAQGPTIFISNFGGNQILSVDGTSGATTVIHTGLSDFVPEDIVVGPDGNIYICDSDSNRIWRLNPNNTLEVEIIYTKAVATDPSGPEGPSFINNTLVFNTRGPNHSGVWKIPGIATVALGTPLASMPSPIQLVTETDTGSTFGEGTDFDEIGNLLIVDRSNSRVLRASAPTFASAPVHIPNLFDPAPADLDLLFGVAVNSKNEIFVASQERGPTSPFPTSDGKIQRFDSNGNFLGTFVSFTPPDAPLFMEFDASDNLFVVTAQNGFGAGGKVWKIDSSGSTVSPFPVVLSDVVADDPELLVDVAVGVAVPPTSTFIPKSFSPEFPTQNFNFGTHSFSISFDEVKNPIDLIVTAEDALPADVEARTGGVPCVQYAYKGGFCVVYVVSGDPLPTPGTDYADTDPDGGILIYIGYFTAGIDAGISGRIRDFSEFVVSEDLDTDPDSDPNLLHDPSGGGDELSDDVTKEFFPQGLPVQEEANFCGFRPPINPDGSSLFKAKRGVVPVKFQLSSSDCTRDFITDAVAWLSVEKISDNGNGTDLQDVESSGKANTGIFFRFDPDDPDGPQYVYNLSMKSFGSGAFRLTVFSNMFPPQFVLISTQ